MTNYAIQTDGLTRNFGEVRAVDDLTLSVEVGEIFGFLGHNGAGKTTTVRLLNGVLQADSGSVSVLGKNPQTDGSAVRARTGVLTETPSLDERLTAVDNLTIYANLYGVPPERIASQVDAALVQFNLAERGADKVGGYSKGMKQRLALARAFLHEPDLIFLDEPTSGLDPIATQDVHDMIRHASRDEGRTVFLCTHNLIEAQRLCDRLAVMEQGRMVAVGTPEQLAQEVGAEVGYTLDVPAEQHPSVKRILDDHAEVRTVQINDGLLTFTVTDRECVPDLLAALIMSQIRVYALEPQQTALEDIYMALHQRRKASE